jgi:hypothetical protein
MEKITMPVTLTIGAKGEAKLSETPRKGDKHIWIIEATVEHDGAPYDIAGATVTLHAKKPDNNTVDITGQIDEKNLHVVSFALTDAVLDQAGTVTCRVDFTLDDSVLHTPPFTFTVAES